jgi:hypothetical protein
MEQYHQTTRTASQSRVFGGEDTATDSMTNFSPGVSIAPGDVFMRLRTRVVEGRAKK